MNAAKLTKKYMMLIVLILLIVFFSIFGENFLSVENAITVCRQVSIIGICATGMMCLSCIFTFSKGAWGGLLPSPSRLFSGQSSSPRTRVS